MGDLQTTDVLPERIDNFDYQVLYSLGAKGLRDRKVLDQRRTTAKANVGGLAEKHERTQAAYEQGRADQARRSRELAETNKEACAGSAEIHREVRDNPSANLDELSHLDAKLWLKPRFLGAVVENYALRWVPVLDAEAQSAFADMLAAKTQEIAWEVVDGFATFVELVGPLARTLGASAIAMPPALEDLMRRLFAAWHAERDAQNAAIDALQKLSVLDQERLSAQIVQAVPRGQ